MKIYVWGCSDDLIEVTGDVTTEYCGNDNNVMLFSDGTELDIEYDGDWTIRPKTLSTLTCTLYDAGSPTAIYLSKGRDYTDVMEIVGEFEWLTVCNYITRVK